METLVAGSQQIPALWGRLFPFLSVIALGIIIEDGRLFVNRGFLRPFR